MKLNTLNPFVPGVDGSEAECEMMFRELLGGWIFTDTVASPQAQLEVFRLVNAAASLEMAA